jgi:hypothetical protein
MPRRVLSAVVILSEVIARLDHAIQYSRGGCA